MAVYKLYSLNSETPEADAIEFTEIQEAIDAAADLMKMFSSLCRKGVSCAEGDFAFAPGEPMKSGLVFGLRNRGNNNTTNTEDDTPFAILEGVTLQQFAELCRMKPDKIERDGELTPYHLN